MKHTDIFLFKLLPQLILNNHCNDNDVVNTPAEEHSDLFVIPHTVVLIQETGLEEKQFQ